MAGGGSGAGQLGRLQPQGSGPCCFDVAPDGRIVVSENQRIVGYSDPDDLFVLTEFDAADFVPDTVATDGTPRLCAWEREPPWAAYRPRRNRPESRGRRCSGSRPCSTSTQTCGSHRWRFRRPDRRHPGGGSSWPITAECQSLPRSRRCTRRCCRRRPSQSATMATRYSSRSCPPATRRPRSTVSPPTAWAYDVVQVPGAADANGVAVWMTPSPRRSGAVEAAGPRHRSWRVGRCPL